MDQAHLAEWTAKYLGAVAGHWANLSEGDDQFPLQDVHVLLEALPPRQRALLERRDELAPDRERLPHADLPPDLPGQQAPQPLEEVLRQHRHLVLLGEPGAGKTTTLQFIGLCFAQEGWAEAKLGLEERRVPVLLPLQAYADLLAKHGGAMTRALAEEVSKRLQRSSEEARALVDAWGERGRLCLLLDGLDEVPEGQREAVRDQVRAWVRAPAGQRGRCIVTSRIAGYTSLGEPLAEFTLRPLEPEQAQEFLRKWLQALARCSQEEAGEKAQDLWDRLQRQPALARLVDNPLILRLAAAHYHFTGGQVARTRAGLYQEYVEEAWRRAERRGAPPGEKGAVLRALQALAWHLHLGGPGDEKAARGALRTYARVEDAERAQALLALAREKAGLVARVRGRLTFSHTTFQEHFVALRLAAAWRKDWRATWRFLRPRLHLPAWREPLLLLAGLLAQEEPGEALRLVRQVWRARSPYERPLRRDLRLAAGLLGAAGLEAPDLVQDLRVMLWGREPGVRWAAAEALEALGPQAAEAVPDLVRAALRDGDPRVQWAAAWALKALGPRAAEAVSDLVRAALRDEDEEVRRAAAEALGALGPQAAEAVSDLRAALRDESWDVRLVAAEALGALGPRAAEAVPDLRAALRDEDEGVREAAAGALKELGPHLPPQGPGEPGPPPGPGRAPRHPAGPPAAPGGAPGRGGAL